MFIVNVTFQLKIDVNFLQTRKSMLSKTPSPYFVYHQTINRLLNVIPPFF